MSLSLCKEEAMSLTLSPVLSRRLARISPVTVPVRTYGTIWDVRTTLVRLHLAHAGIVGDFIDVDRETSDLRVKSLPVPSVYIDGEWLHAPRLAQIDEALNRHGLLAAPKKRQ
jgi:hypothetical protein